MSGPFSHKSHKRLKDHVLMVGIVALRYDNIVTNCQNIRISVESPTVFAAHARLMMNVYSRVIVQYSQFASGVTEEGVGPPRVIQVVDCACYQDRSNLTSFPPILWGRGAYSTLGRHMVLVTTTYTILRQVQYTQYIRTVHTVQTLHIVHTYSTYSTYSTHSTHSTYSAHSAHSTHSIRIQYKQYILYIQYIHTVHKVHPFVFPVNIKYIQYIQYTQYKQYTQYTQSTQYTQYTQYTLDLDYVILRL